MSRYTDLLPVRSDLARMREEAGVTAASFVYAIEAHESRRVKIGRASKPEARVDALQTGAPERLDLICVAAETETFNETTLHQYLHPRRRTGEWFDLTAAEALEVFAEFGADPLVYPSQARQELFWRSDEYRRAVAFHRHLERAHKLVAA